MGSSVAEVATLFSTPVVKINIDREFTEDEVDCLQNIPIHKNPNTMMNHRSVDSFLFDNFAKELKDIKGNPLGAGLVMNNDSIALYSTFLSKKAKKTHIDVMTADGFLHYDKNTKEYQISNMDKLTEKRWNRRLNMWIRCPGIVSFLPFAYTAMLESRTSVPFPILVAQGALNLINGVYFADRVSGNAAVAEYKAAEKQQRTKKKNIE